MTQRSSAPTEDATPRTEMPRAAVRGASEEMLSTPAGTYLAALRWNGPADDPDRLSAATFLARL